MTRVAQRFATMAHPGPLARPLLPPSPSQMRRLADRLLAQALFLYDTLHPSTDDDARAGALALLAQWAWWFGPSALSARRVATAMREAAARREREILAQRTREAKAAAAAEAASKRRPSSTAAGAASPAVSTASGSSSPTALLHSPAQPTASGKGSGGSAPLSTTGRITLPAVAALPSSALRGGVSSGANGLPASAPLPLLAAYGASAVMAVVVPGASLAGASGGSSGFSVGDSGRASGAPPEECHFGPVAMRVVLGQLLEGTTRFFAAPGRARRAAVEAVCVGLLVGDASLFETSELVRLFREVRAAAGEGGRKIGNIKRGQSDTRILLPTRV